MKTVLICALKVNFIVRSIGSLAGKEYDIWCYGSEFRVLEGTRILFLLLLNFSLYFLYKNNEKLTGRISPGYLICPGYLISPEEFGFSRILSNS
jgi:hypothetical protein